MKPGNGSFALSKKFFFGTLANIDFGRPDKSASEQPSHPVRSRNVGLLRHLELGIPLENMLGTDGIIYGGIGRIRRPINF